MLVGFVFNLHLYSSFISRFALVITVHSYAEPILSTHVSLTLALSGVQVELHCGVVEEGEGLTIVGASHFSLLGLLVLLHRPVREPSVMTHEYSGPMLAVHWSLSAC